MAEQNTIALVYVAGPFRGATAWDIECNVRRAEALGLEVARAGAMPIIPHCNTRFFQGQCSDALWLDGTLEMLRRCDAAIFTPDWERSFGACRERAEAHDVLKLPIFDSIETLRAWLKAENREAYGDLVRRRLGDG